MPVWFMMCVTRFLSQVLSDRMEPTVGIEPTTCSLRMSCSTSWATLAWICPYMLKASAGKLIFRIKHGNLYTVDHGMANIFRKFAGWFSKGVMSVAARKVMDVPDSSDFQETGNTRMTWPGIYVNLLRFLCLRSMCVVWHHQPVFLWNI